MVILIFLLGIIIGSFLNVCIYRIPKGESIVFPSSHCPGCSTPLKWYDLVPVLSFLFQGGKCRYCGENISPRYPIVELLDGIIFITLYFILGFNLDFIFYAFLFSLLIIITFIDLDYQIIPNILVILILLGSIIYKLLNLLLYGIPLNLFNGLMGLTISGLIFLIILIVSKGGMGGGDVKLIGVLGFILGVPKIFLNIFLSFLIGGIISIFLLGFKIKGRKDPIPFGPFITLAFTITLFWGNRIIDWYIASFLLR
ncbi:prepilin peptidase [Clostridium sp. Cult2]|uniref:prepilin peptidase n=1 Tax=Clostridium sp. Cult2 TaxID=2079003 RepID=UPI001F2785E5|nr:A24 family peptidase [Clostridium sp. Cult2]MCF6465640.1 prepilin peptidase [Clostridium sp. Cult2]